MKKFDWFQRFPSLVMIPTFIDIGIHVRLAQKILLPLKAATGGRLFIHSSFELFVRLEESDHYGSKLCYKTVFILDACKSFIRLNRSAIC